MEPQKRTTNETSALQESYDPFFIVERFMFKQRLELIKQIEKIPKVDYKKIGRELLLQNLFLKKFRLDPGFRFKIYVELNRNEKILRKIKREFLTFVQDSNLFANIHSLSKEDDEALDLYEEKFKLQNPRAYNYPDLFTSALFPSKTKKRWFYQKWKTSMEAGKLPEAYTAESILLELITEYHQGYYLFWTTNPYGENRNAYHYLLSAIREIVENVDPFFLDYVEAQRNNVLLCEAMQDVVDNLSFQLILNDVNECVEHFQDLTKGELEIIGKVKLRKSIQVIMGILYFNSLPTERKLILLNRMYGIDSLIEGLVSDPSIYDLNQFMADLPIWLSLIHI